MYSPKFVHSIDDSSMFIMLMVLFEFFIDLGVNIHG
jgi:hypothetical protein